MKSIECTIKGVSPLLMNRFPLEPIANREKLPPREQAELCLYLTDDGRPHIPTVNLHRAFVAAAIYSKGKGRASLQKFVSAGLFIEDAVALLDGETSDWVVDSRATVVPATHGRVIRHRARFDLWQCSFTLLYDERFLSEEQVRKVVDDTGTIVGILDYRPEKKGTFGRFIVTEWNAPR